MIGLIVHNDPWLGAEFEDKRPLAYTEYDAVSWYFEDFQISEDETYHVDMKISWNDFVEHEGMNEAKIGEYRFRYIFEGGVAFPIVGSVMMGVKGEEPIIKNGVVTNHPVRFKYQVKNSIPTFLMNEW